MSSPAIPPPPDPSTEFEEFFRATYRSLVKFAMYAGATEDQADEAVAITMGNVYERWDKIRDPSAYARRATLSNFLKEKTRPRRLLTHLLESGEVANNQEDSGMTMWEDTQWVTQLLGSLPVAQRVVMAYIVDDFKPAEVALLLGKSPDAVRQNLCAARQRLTLTLSRRTATDASADGEQGSTREDPR